MKKLIPAILYCLATICCFSQPPTQAELDKMMKDAKEMLKQYKGDSLVRQKMKELEKNEDQFTRIATNPSAYDPQRPSKFPERQTKLLATVPKKPLSAREVQNFSAALYADLKKYISRSSIQSVEKMITQLQDAQAISEAAVFCWYNNAPEQATLLSVYAASKNTDAGILNNCGAILNLAGLEAKALPILRSLLPLYPDNSTVLNNIGQAYAVLGAADSAMFYLMACMKLSSNHPQACGTAAYLERERNNPGKEKEYIKKALEGSYDENLVRRIRFLEPDFRLSRFVRPRVKVPEYFNIHKFLPFPEPCTSVNDIPRARAEYKAYGQMLSESIARLRKEEMEIAESVNAVMAKVTGGFAIRKGNIMRTSFYRFCTEMTTDLAEEHGELVMRYDEQRKQFNAEVTKLDELYKKAAAAIEKKYAGVGKDCCGEGNASCCPSYEAKCKELEALANVYLPKYANLTRDLQQKAIHPYQNFNERALWDYLTYAPVPPMGITNFRGSFYAAAIGYLTTLQSIAHTKLIIPCKDPGEGTAPVKEVQEEKEPECPYNIKLPFIVGKMALNCEAFTLELNVASFALDLEKGFDGRPSTLAVGAGIIEKIPVIIKGGVQEQFFITVNGENEISDFGLKVEGKVSVPFTVDEKAGWKLGINSGWSFNEGPLKGVANKIFGIR